MMVVYPCRATRAGGARDVFGMSKRRGSITREHIIRTCTHYANHRKNLQDENREIALPELLGTPNGIAALTNFLQGSGAFTFTGEKFTPRNAPSFEAEAEPPNIDSEDEESDSDQ